MDKNFVSTTDPFLIFLNVYCVDAVKDGKSESYKGIRVFLECLKYQDSVVSWCLPFLRRKGKQMKIPIGTISLDSLNLSIGDINIIKEKGFVEKDFPLEKLKLDSDGQELVREQLNFSKEKLTHEKGKEIGQRIFSGRRVKIFLQIKSHDFSEISRSSTISFSFKS